MSTAHDQTADLTPALRYHDLDALRAFAMLLGIVLHVALSFVAGSGWPVTDISEHRAYGAAVSVIHVFRMPLFFMMSGFFTAMLLSRRGIGGMVSHRKKRILVPLLIGMATVIPVTWGAFIGAGIAAAMRGFDARADASETIWGAAVDGDLEQLNTLIDSGADIDLADPQLATTPLAWAVAGGQTEALELLLDSGADPNQGFGDRSQTTPMHTAAFFGRAEAARLLLDAGAESDRADAKGERPIDAMNHGQGTVDYVAGLLGVTVPYDEVEAGRAEIRVMLEGDTAAGSDASAWPGWVYSLFFEFPFFMHLWFLWHLCIFIGVYALLAIIAKRLPRFTLPSVLVATPLCLSFLIPLTAWTQSYQGEMGPATTAAFIPFPKILLHYAVFFGFGVLMHASLRSVETLGRWWSGYLIAAAGSAVVMLSIRAEAGWIVDHLDPWLVDALSFVTQSTFAWTFIFALMGIFRSTLNTPRPWVRYASDSSYWLYLAHMPLVLLGQVLIANIEAPGIVKLTLLVGVTTAILLASYQWFVRYTFIGRLLNGPRERPARATSPAVGA
ncbi:MAG: acyltransferase family protein [Planctomycetota bacterium]